MANADIIKTIFGIIATMIGGTGLYLLKQLVDYFAGMRSDINDIKITVKETAVKVAEHDRVLVDHKEWSRNIEAKVDRLGYNLAKG